MGRLLSKLPTDVHLGKFLLMATLFHCLDPALTVAAALSSKSPFISPFGLEREAEQAKAYFKTGAIRMPQLQLNKTKSTVRELRLLDYKQCFFDLAKDLTQSRRR